MADIVLQENLLVRMQEDIRRALEKPEGERRWGMVIDLRKCVGCHACTSELCGREQAATRRRLPARARSGDRNVPQRDPALYAAPLLCSARTALRAGLSRQRHLQRPDGIVAIDYEQCIGCRYCITACPYSARAPSMLATPTRNRQHPQRTYELLPNYEYGVEHARVPGSDESPIGNARKCHFCLHRLEQGALPMCVTTCIGVANFFGDLNDPTSLVAQWRRSQCHGAERRTRHQTQSGLSGLGEANQ